VKNSKQNLPLAIGLFLFAIIQVINQSHGMPHILYDVMIALVLVLEIWGVALVFRSPAMQNSRLRQWKLHLIRKIIGK